MTKFDRVPLIGGSNYGGGGFWIRSQSYILEIVIEVMSLKVIESHIQLEQKSMTLSDLEHQRMLIILIIGNQKIIR